MKVLEVEGLSKLYRLGEVGTGTLSHDINRWWAKMRGQEDPYAKVGQVNDRSKKGESDYVWVLKDINFSVEQGEVLGIIGRNGAGKSTLLKLISQITAPTSGTIKAKGRIASLLEVGTGMNPELTARENIFLNGAILGMRKSEIVRKLDEIVDFSGCALYLDTPLKRFSSGMRVRLGFAVAAFLEPEILIIDEVLAVGDADFQKKAIGKMKDVSGKEGRTVIFVSHNMAAVKSLCTRGIILENGEQVFSGPTEEAVSRYLVGSNDILNLESPGIESAGFRLNQVGARVKGKGFDEPISRAEAIEVVVSYECQSSSQFHLVAKLKGDDGTYFLTTSSNHITDLISNGTHSVALGFPPYFLNDGTVYLDLLVVKDKKEPVIMESDIISFVINPEQKPLGSWMGREKGYVRGRFEWNQL